MGTSDGIKNVMAELKQLEGKIQIPNDKIQTFQDSLSEEIKTLCWFIAFVMAVLIVIVAEK